MTNHILSDSDLFIESMSTSRFKTKEYRRFYSELRLNSCDVIFECKSKYPLFKEMTDAHKSS